MFKIVEYPSSVPLQDLEVSYKRQNEIIEHIKYLHTAFDGIILGNIETDNAEAPFIMAGSICLFCETIFYIKHDIEVADETDEAGMRFISLTYNNSNKTLLANIEHINQGSFKPERGKVYFYDKGIIKKYLDFSMYFKGGAYYSKKYIKQEQR